MKPSHNARIRTPSADFDTDKLLTLRGRIALVVEKDEAGMRLDAFLASRLTWRSRTSIRSLIENGDVELAERSARASRKVKRGEEVRVRLPQPKRDQELPESGEIPLEVLYEDRWLLAVNKPANIPVHPSGRLLHRTLITELHRRYRVYGDPERDIVPKLCHRLDLETSGVLLVAKSDAVAAAMGEQLQARATQKEYLAIVHGVVEQDEFSIDAPLGDALGSEIYLRRGVRPEGEPARTGLRVERRFREFTLVRLRLFTGRRHQIRVHLSHVGYPIVGDKMYGLDEQFFLDYFEGRLGPEQLRDLRLPRQALHAAFLRVEHPLEKQPLEITAPLPADLDGFLAELED